jgi:site-specific recombinase XerD
MAHEEFLQPFQEHLAGKLQKRSILAYGYDVEGFLSFMERRSGVSLDQQRQHAFFNGIREPDIYAYINHLKDEEHNSERTINRKLTSISAFFDHLIHAAILESDHPLKGVPRYQLQEMRTVIVEDDVIQKMFSKIRPRHIHRDRAMLILIVECGLKVTQLVGLKQSDYDGEYLSLAMGGIRLSKTAKVALDDYIRIERKNAPSPYIFVSQKNETISIRTIQQVIKNLRDDLKTEAPLTSDALRNATILKLLKEDMVDDQHIKQYFGHQKTLHLEKVLFSSVKKAKPVDFDFSKSSVKTTKK